MKIFPIFSKLNIPKKNVCRLTKKLKLSTKEKLIGIHTYLCACVCVLNSNSLTTTLQRFLCVSEFLQLDVSKIERQKSKKCIVLRIQEAPDRTF